MDIAKLLEPITEDNPCGPNLEYDPEFLALEKDIAGEPERYIGDIPAKEPNWKEIKSRAQALLLRSKDLNAMMWFVRSCTRCDGIHGLSSGLHIIQDCLTQYWDCCHPCLDSEDDNDPEARLNILSQIGNYDFLVRDVRNILLTIKVQNKESETPIQTQLSVRDILIGQGKLSVQDYQPAYTQTQIEGIFQDENNTQIKRDLIRQLNEIVKTLNNISKALNQKLGESYRGGLPDFEKLKAVLAVIKRLCEDEMVSGEVTNKGSATESDNSIDTPVESNATSSSEIRSREDVIRSLEKVSRYIERTEPTNPASLIIRFAQSLMTKNFVEIMEVLPPEDLKIFKKILDANSKK